MRLVFGVGLNDANYSAQPVVNGKQVTCMYYRRWKEMLNRCYSQDYKKKHSTYKDCTVCEEWLTFSNFKAWMETQDWNGKHLDKDFIVEGNKIYSPETCAFIDPVINKFITDRGNDRGDCPIGVYWHARDKAFVAQCSNPYRNKQEWLGRFSCKKEAHLAWKKRKHEFACELANTQDDPRVADALRSRYAK
jgi:hypothetical protein